MLLRDLMNYKFLNLISVPGCFFTINSKIDRLMTNPAPKSFPRELLLNVAGTFDDKVRQMLAEKNASENKATRADTKATIEPTTKNVPGVRKTIAKPIISQSSVHLNREPVVQQPTQYRQEPMYESNRAPIYQSQPNQGFFQQPNPNPMPQAYPASFPMDRGSNFQRNGMMPSNQNSQSGMPYQSYHQQPHYNQPPFYANGNGNAGPGANLHYSNDFIVKSEEPMYFERGSMMMMHDNHDTFSNGSTASTNEPIIARNGSNNRGQVSGLKLIANSMEMDRYEHERPIYNGFETRGYNQEPI